MSWTAIGTAMAAALALTAPAHAQSVEEFYRGKTVNILVGFTAGGGYDLYARVLGRHSAGTFPAIRRSWCRTCRAPAR